ncbi:MAG: PIN domain-containing protein [Propionibacteriaceae bacterium]|jgi:predicted nucleic-acid-binding protein|nr:PIN domain-containing protein [Propionibacteriaceae bacterium]
MAPSLDTNCLLRWVLNDVPAQAEQISALLRGNDELCVSDQSLCEFVYVLSEVYQLERGDIVSSLKLLMSESKISFDRQVWTAVVKGYSAHPKLSVVDVLLVEQAHRSGNVPIYTFDKKLAAQMENAALVPESGPL